MTTTSTTSTTLPGRRADQLIERARIAFLRAGGRDQPSQDSDVTDVDGVTTITLRNINGVLAVYELHGDALKRQAITAVLTTTVDQLFDGAFDRPRDPRSAEYKAGCRAALEFRIDGAPINRPYSAGSAADDAFDAGMAEGHAIWRAAAASAAGAA